MRFSQQRGFGLAVFLILAAEIVCLHLAYARQMPRLSYLTGWALLGVILLLALYNGRKKLPFLPLLSSEEWLQFHIYAGLLTGVLFAVHLNYKIPSGWFQGVLAWLYLLVMASGLFGLFISRAIPKRLTTRGGEVLFERIPSLRRQLQEQAEQLALSPRRTGEVPPEPVRALWAEITERLDRIERALSGGLPHDDQKTALGTSVRAGPARCGPRRGGNGSAASCLGRESA